MFISSPVSASNALATTFKFGLQGSSDDCEQESNNDHCGSIRYPELLVRRV